MSDQNLTLPAARANKRWIMGSDLNRKLCLACHP